MKQMTDREKQILETLNRFKAEIISIKSKESAKSAGVSAAKQDNIASPAALKAMYEKLKAEARSGR